MSVFSDLKHESQQLCDERDPLDREDNSEASYYLKLRRIGPLTDRILQVSELPTSVFIVLSASSIELFFEFGFMNAEYCYLISNGSFSSSNDSSVSGAKSAL